MPPLKEYYRYFQDEMEYDEFKKMIDEKRKMYGNLYDEETIALYFLASNGKLKEVITQGEKNKYK
ncbi:MAG: hypothetical protein ACPL1Y_03500 [Thermoplasmata archaeon]